MSNEPIESAKQAINRALAARDKVDISWIQPPPEKDGWTLAGDALRFLDALVRELRPKHVIEFGAGLSTKVLARACVQMGMPCAISSVDHDPQWYGRTRDPGHYISTAWIDGNFLAEGTLIVGAAMSTMDPVLVHFHEREAVAFQIVDSLDGGSARGDFAGTIPGVVRPMLKWTTSFDSRQTNAEVWSVREGA